MAKTLKSDIGLAILRIFPSIFLLTHGWGNLTVSFLEISNFRILLELVPPLPYSWQSSGNLFALSLLL